MEKIDFSDKFIHSPNWQDNYSEEALERFRKIIKNGYILTPNEWEYKSRYYKDRIFFAVFPNGKYANDYPARRYTFLDGTNGYLMATSGFFFILNSKLRDDYDLESGKYEYECFSKSSIELYKYLEGIGNAGFNIAECLTYSYYYIKYLNGEIPASKVIEIVEERNLGLDLVDSIRSIGKWINSMSYPEYNYFNQALSSDVESLLKKGNYYNIVRILNEEGKNISLYDKYGYRIDPSRRIDEVIEMREYLEQQKPIQTGDEYFQKVEELCSLAEKQKIKV